MRGPASRDFGRRADTRFNGDGFVPDVRFDDAVGGTVGFGWRSIGLTYTNIQCRSPLTDSLDANNGGISFTWEFQAPRGADIF